MPRPSTVHRSAGFVDPAGRFTQAPGKIGVEAWQNRSLASVYPIIYLDAIHIKLRREGKVENIAVYTVLGVDVEGHRDILGLGSGKAMRPPIFG